MPDKFSLNTTCVDGSPEKSSCRGSNYDLVDCGYILFSYVSIYLGDVNIFYILQNHMWSLLQIILWANVFFMLMVIDVHIILFRRES